MSETQAEKTTWTVARLLAWTQEFFTQRGLTDARLCAEILLAHSMKPLPGHERLAQTLQKHGETLFGEPIPAVGTPLYTDVRLYGEHGIPGVIYGAGPRTVLESHAKRADERLVLEDLRRATQVVARTLLDLTTPES